MIYKFLIICKDLYHRDEFKKILEIEAVSLEAAKEKANEYIQESNNTPRNWMKYELEVING